MSANPSGPAPRDPAMTLDAGQTTKVMRPTARFMLSHPAHLIAMGFGSGLSPVSPGTVGTLYGWLSYVVISMWVQPFTWLWLIAGGFVLGLWACNRTARDMGVHDHGSMVWDEIVAIWLVLAFVTPTSFWGQFAAFLWFRLFDIAKPAPIGHYDRSLKGPGLRGAFGVMFDDVLAAFYTLLVFAIWRSI
ncbi:phosphatidylglycerophosphatase A [Cupriavidus sp. USMAHM13]|uniref:phosphatidylglycerophosphatase A family protein n=1 Tax=Cupriavidus sp. USMAHM13 TaxID=1389192 RepID=UPI0008A6F6A1|nr:phosphatidylglycerophosphatase A [Cupriavidus sp. USMAHM13]AOZ00786.1 phosphatidylglycerophosphatase A [Cupriavidus sp. USMAHM13]